MDPAGTQHPAPAALTAVNSDRPEHCFHIQPRAHLDPARRVAMASPEANLPPSTRAWGAGRPAAVNLTRRRRRARRDHAADAGRWNPRSAHCARPAPWSRASTIGRGHNPKSPTHVGHYNYASLPALTSTNGTVSTGLTVSTR